MQSRLTAPDTITSGTITRGGENISRGGLNLHMKRTNNVHVE